MSACCYCTTTSDLRPYGPGGAPICFECMMADPARETEAKRQFRAAGIAATEMDPDGIAVLTPDGPVPLKDLDEGGEHG